MFHSLCYAVQTQQNNLSSDCILIINSYTEMSLWSNDFIDPIYKEYSTAKSHVDIHTEHMNMLIINDEEALQEYKEEFISKIWQYSSQTNCFIRKFVMGITKQGYREALEKYTGYPLCRKEIYR